ncbi:MAG: methyltransferase regulatory domain-containing protein [Holophagales bacterium]|jgi:hypothetical protein|nr:methyltransferase regulatory domain-containing protein [Holophagales bacterium]MBK9965360.1 methyltransferase regulatory domain-containing protein [Holophagales bacterium]
MTHLDATRESYEAMPYERLVHRFTHPDRIALAVRRHGFEPVPAAGARVLELGCASGDNLVGMAYGLPSARFVGVDFSARQIGAGRRLVEALGIRNVSLVAGDLGDVDEGWGAFDYVLAHGVLSWVPEPVRRRVFEVCGERLSERGAAFVSWNALPGWRFRHLVRDVLRAGAGGAREPGERARLARERLALVAASVVDPAGPWGRYLAERGAELADESDADLLHDYLEEENEAFSLGDVVARAGAAGLDYLCDAQEPFVPPETWSPEVRRVLEGLRGEVEREELLDVLRERTLRQGLFVRAGAKRGPREVPAAEEGLELASVPLSRGAPLSPRPRASALARLQAADGPRVTSFRHRNVTLDPLATAVLLLLDGTRTVEEVAGECGEPEFVAEAVVERLRADALLEA